MRLALVKDPSARPMPQKRCSMSDNFDRRGWSAERLTSRCSEDVQMENAIKY